MDVTVKDLKVERARRAVNRVIARYGLRWNDISLVFWREKEDREQDQARENAFNAVKGMWKGRRIDPILYQRKIRRESDRRLPRT